MQVLQIEKPTGTKFDEVIEDFYYLPIETTTNSLIGQFRDIELFEDYIYIQDVETKLLYIFNKDGKYINNLGKRGNGPNDLLHLTTFTIDRGEKQVIVYDSFKKEFFFYTLRGEFKKRVATPIRFSNKNFGIDQYDRMVVASLSCNNPELEAFDSSCIFLLDSTFNITNASLLKSDGLIANYIPNILVRNGNQIAYTSNYAYDFYTVNQSGIQLKYRFDISAYENALDTSKLSALKENTDEMHRYYFSSAHILPPVLFTNNNLFFKLQTANISESNYCYYNKKTNEVLSFPNLDNVITDNGLIFSSVLSTHNDYFVGYVSPQLAMNHKEQLGEFAKHINFDDNAILVFFKLK